MMTRQQLTERVKELMETAVDGAGEELAQRCRETSRIVFMLVRIAPPLMLMQVIETVIEPEEEQREEQRIGKLEQRLAVLEGLRLEERLKEIEESVETLAQGLVELRELDHRLRVFEGRPA